MIARYEEWVFCRMTGIGVLQELLKNDAKPTLDEIAAVLSQEGEKPGNEFLKKLSNFVDGVGS